MDINFGKYVMRRRFSDDLRKRVTRTDSTQVISKVKDNLKGGK